MITALICLLISGIIKISLDRLSETYDWLTKWQPYLNWIVIVFAVILGLLIVIRIIKEITKKK